MILANVLRGEIEIYNLKGRTVHGKQQQGESLFFSTKFEHCAIINSLAERSKAT
jgi:hypothetical protein